jgi:hypothetical protein
MYDLPKGTTLKFLKQRQVELLCFGPYSVTLHFDEGIRIQVESAFRHIVAADDGKAAKSSFPLSYSRLMRLLGERVSKVETERDGTLSLTFSNQDMLIIDGNSGPYEAYQVRYGDREIVV